MHQYKIDSSLVKIFETRKEMGTRAAECVASKIKELLSQKEYVNIVFAAAPSQNEFLQALLEQNGISWNRINAFHMDEYIGLPANAPQSFGNFLKDKIFDKIPFATVHFLNGNVTSPQFECQRYGELLVRYPTDIVCMGIGENTHIAFNDPHVADFKDKDLVKVVELDQVCRQQQVNDDCFAKIEMVPVSALTLTVPALLSAAFIYCIVPGQNKSNAVRLSLTEEISENYPATILRRHNNCQMFLDKDSASNLDQAFLPAKGINK